PEPHHRQHRSKDLLLLETHSRLDACENRGLEEETVIEPLTLRAPAPVEQIGTVGLTDVDVPLDLLDCLLIDQRPDLGPGLPAVAELERPRPIDEAAQKLVVNAVLQNEAARRRAALSRGAKGAPEDALERQIEIRVVEHEHG